jgi:hypothetical protein
MAGEAKRDYPAPIGYQSPWYREYSYIENYFARLNTVLTRGKAEVKVGVIHPIESYWLYWGTKEHTEGIRSELDNKFLQVVKWLLYGLIDFDFISEALLPELWSKDDLKTEESGLLGFKAGAMEYDVIVVPNCITLRATTAERLLAFIKKGGKVILTGRTPSYIDAVPSELTKELLKRSNYIDFNENDLLLGLSPYRSIDVHDEQGIRTDNLLYQMRNDTEGKWLFLTHAEKPANLDIPKKEKLSIRVDGLWRPVKYNALTGDIKSCQYEYIEGKTNLKEEIYEQDSLLYYLEPVTEHKAELKTEHKEELKTDDKTEHKIESRTDNNASSLACPEKVVVTLSELNVLLLDMAQYRFDDGEWQPQEEILRIDNLFREVLGYPMRTEAFAQPWLISEKEEVKHKLSLRFRIFSEYKVPSPSLALENVLETTVLINGNPVPSVVNGWYTDRDIQTIPLPDLTPGENTLEVIIPYYSKQNVENLYLLGDFSVFVAGRTAVISKPIHELAFGDIGTQGLPFYGGNVTYEIPVITEAGELFMEATQFRCPVIKVALDGEEIGCLTFSPYQIKLGRVTKGKHVISITAFGNRYNTFGPIHNCNRTEFWFGPNAWRSTGTSWSYEYQLKQSDILISPKITMIS